MFRVLKRTILLRRFFWAPTTYVFVEKDFIHSNLGIKLSIKIWEIIQINVPKIIFWGSFI